MTLSIFVFGATPSSPFPRQPRHHPRLSGGALLSPAAALLSSPMAQLALHHINVIVTDLPRSLALSEAARPHNHRTAALQKRRRLARQRHPAAAFDRLSARLLPDQQQTRRRTTRCVFLSAATALPVTPSSSSSILIATSSRSTARRSQPRLTPVPRVAADANVDSVEKPASRFSRPHGYARSVPSRVRAAGSTPRAPHAKVWGDMVHTCVNASK
jgi:hypothetical protein